MIILGLPSQVQDHRAECVILCVLLCDIFSFVFYIFQVDVYGGTSYLLTNLSAATVYDVNVMTVNSRGSSLPDVTLVVVTEGNTIECDCQA